jgi:hypothetical protein
MAEKQTPAGFLGAGFFLVANPPMEHVIGAAATAVDVAIPLTGGGVVVTWRDVNPAGVDNVLSLRLNGGSAGIARSGFYTTIGGAPLPFGDALSAFMVATAASGYQLRITVLCPRASQRGGNQVVFVDGSYGNASGVGLAGYWGWYGKGGTTADDLTSIGIASDQINGLSAAASYSVQLVG